jgi:thymidylate kinase
MVIKKNNITNNNSKNKKVKKKITKKTEIKKIISNRPSSKTIKFKKLNRDKKVIIKRKLISKMSYDKDTSKIFLDLFSTLSKNNIEIHYVNGKIVYKTMK